MPPQPPTGVQPPRTPEPRRPAAGRGERPRGPSGRGRADGLATGRARSSRDARGPRACRPLRTAPTGSGRADNQSWPSRERPAPAHTLPDEERGAPVDASGVFGRGRRRAARSDPESRPVEPGEHVARVRFERQLVELAADGQRRAHVGQETQPSEVGSTGSGMTKLSSNLALSIVTVEPAPTEWPEEGYAVCVGHPSG